MAEPKPSRLERTAYHEAGHAVVAYRLGVPIIRVSIVPSDDGETLGTCEHLGWGQFDPHALSNSQLRRRLEPKAMVGYAGAITEGILAGRHNWQGAKAGVYGITDLLLELAHSQEEADAYARWLWIRTKDLLAVPVNWAAVQAVANHLLEHREASGLKVHQVIRESLQGYLVKLLAERRETR